MNPMTHLILATAAFLLTHGTASTPLRAGLMRVLGVRGYFGIYSATALALLVWMAWAYYHAPFIGLWHPAALRYAPLAVMPFAMVLIAAGLMTHNPTLAGQEHLLGAAEPARGILRITRHPLLWGIALWAGSHVLARGDAATLVFFGAFLALALVGTVLIDRRRRAALGPAWARFAEHTSNLPGAAIASGRNEFRAAEIGWAPWLAGLALYLAALLVHPHLFGARPY